MSSFYQRSSPLGSCAPCKRLPCLTSGIYDTAVGRIWCNSSSVRSLRFRLPLFYTPIHVIPHTSVVPTLQKVGGNAFPAKTTPMIMRRSSAEMRRDKKKSPTWYSGYTTAVYSVYHTPEQKPLCGDAVFHFFLSSTAVGGRTRLFSCPLSPKCLYFQSQRKQPMCLLASSTLWTEKFKQRPLRNLPIKVCKLHYSYFFC